MESAIKLFFLTTLTMVAFAASSILNRLALAVEEIGPSAFASIRVGAGAAVLILLLSLRDRAVPKFAKPNIAAFIALTAYMLGFSYAYVTMDAGLGALILFGGVQITMFVGAVLEGQNPSLRRWLGMGLAVMGLAVLANPFGAVEFTPAALALMSCAALGWGVYSLIGRGVADPIHATAWNFIYCLPLVLLAWLVWPDTTSISGNGIALAIVSGGITSALGYALWYSLLPQLGATRGALAQLSVPAIAMGMGIFVLSESITATAVLSAAMILGGIAVGLVSPVRKDG